MTDQRQEQAMSTSEKPRPIIAEIEFPQTDDDLSVSMPFVVEEVLQDTPTYLRVLGRFEVGVTYSESLAPRRIRRYGNRGEWTFPWARIASVRWRKSIFPGPPGGEILPPTVDEQLQELERRVAQLEWIDQEVRAALGQAVAEVSVDGDRG